MPSAYHRKISTLPPRGSSCPKYSIEGRAEGGQALLKIQPKDGSGVIEIHMEFTSVCNLRSLLEDLQGAVAMQMEDDGD